MDNEKEKMVPIEPLPQKERVYKPPGRKPLSAEEKAQRRIAKGQNPMKDQVSLTPARKRAMEKARLVRSLKAEYRHETDEVRKEQLAVQINSLTPNKIVPVANQDLKQKIKYQNPTYKEEGIEDYIIDYNATVINPDQPETSDKLYKWADSYEKQRLWQGQIAALETKMNNLDEYLSKIRVLSSEGDTADYSTPMNVKQNHFIQQHNSHMNPHHGPTNPSPFVSSFRSLVMKKKE